MKNSKNRKTIGTPRGNETGSQPVDGFQIARIEDFLHNPNIPHKTKATPHILHFDLILICTKGKGTHHIDFEDYQFNAPTIFVIKKGKFHAWDLDANINGFMLFFEIDFDIQLGKEIPLTHNSLRYYAPKHPVVSINNTQDFDLFNALSEALHNEFYKKKQNKELLKAYLAALLTKIDSEIISTDTSAIQNDDYQLFKQFIELLDVHIQTSRNVNFYSEMLDLSFDRLNNASRKVTGLSLKRYIDTFIVNRAKRFLFSSDKNISEIAYSFGFKEVGNFSKYFKKKTGLSPLQFRKKFKK